MSKKTVTLHWSHGSEEQTLADIVDQLCSKLSPATINYSYLEWRPGAALLIENAGSAPVLVTGKPNHNTAIALDELRLFGTDCGLRAVEDGGKTRWMCWSNRTPEFAQGEEAEELEVEEYSYPIQMLDKDAANRFGIKQNLPGKDQLKIIEYRSAGNLFCWNLKEKKS